MVSKARNLANVFTVSLAGWRFGGDRKKYGSNDCDLKKCLWNCFLGGRKEYGSNDCDLKKKCLWNRVFLVVIVCGKTYWFLNKLLMWQTLIV